MSLSLSHEKIFVQLLCLKISISNKTCRKKLHDLNSRNSMLSWEPIHRSRRMHAKKSHKRMKEGTQQVNEHNFGQTLDNRQTLGTYTSRQARMKKSLKITITCRREWFYWSSKHEAELTKVPQLSRCLRFCEDSVIFPWSWREVESSTLPCKTVIRSGFNLLCYSLYVHIG